MRPPEQGVTMEGRGFSKCHVKNTTLGLSLKTRLSVDCKSYDHGIIFIAESYFGSFQVDIIPNTYASVVIETETT